MVTTSQGIEIAPADQRLRKWFLLIVLAWLIVLLIIATVVFPELERIGHPPVGREWLLRAVILATLGPPLFLFASCAALGARAIKHSRWPPPNFPLLMNTRVIVGRRATFKGWRWFLESLVGGIAASVLLVALISNVAI